MKNKKTDNIFSKDVYLNELSQINSPEAIIKAFIVVISPYYLGLFITGSYKLPITFDGIIADLVETVIIAFAFVSLIFFYLNIKYKKIINSNYNTDFKINQNLIDKKLLCKIVTKSKSYNGHVGNLYFGETGFIFIHFKDKKNENIAINTLSELKFELVYPKLDPITKWVHKNFLRKNLRIYTKSNSQLFQVPEPQETLKKLETIKQELLSQQDSSSGGNT